jgi:hypothetical protein
MSLYLLRRAIFDNMRAGEVSSGKTPACGIGAAALMESSRYSSPLVSMPCHPL